MNGVTADPWLTWALQALTVAVIIWFKRDLDRNTDAITQLRVHLAENYVSKEEHKTWRDVVHSLREVMDNVMHYLRGNGH